MPDALAAFSVSPRWKGKQRYDLTMRRSSIDLSEPPRNLEETFGASVSDPLDATYELSVPDPEEDMEAADGDPSRFATLHARLPYHPRMATNQTRRKDSAASSRRNSISSVHSRSSHGCASLSNAGPQSKYVAQHLRRVSILEDRKARLADRAAHAEKVRHRAQKAKLAAQETKNSSEERALAAALARENKLAEIVANCADQVKRAKAVAEVQKQKREQELRERKLQIEGRHAEAERRREEFRRNQGKTKGSRERGYSPPARQVVLVEVMPQVAEVKERERSRSPIRHQVAVTRLQHAWRSCLRRRAVTEFSELGLSIDGVRATSFDHVTDLLSREKVLVETARVLRICGLKESEPGSVDEMTVVRAFLSAFLILGHPGQVLSNKEGKGDQDQDVVAKARDLLIAFETLMSRLTELNNYTAPPVLLAAFPDVYATFYNAFIAWKTRDSNSLVELMVSQFVELDAIIQTVENGSACAVEALYRESIKENQVQLWARIKRLAGPVQGKNMVTEAIRKARKSRAKKPAGADLRPRIVEHTDVFATDQAPTRDTPRPGNHVAVPFGHSAGLLPDNRTIVHELAIDREFRIEPFEYRRRQVHVLAPIFDLMRNTMESDDQESHFFLLLEVADMVRDKLQRLVRPGTTMHTFIDEMLDKDVAKQQFRVGNFSYDKFFQAMAMLLPKLCAPVRDEDLKLLVDNKLGQGNYVDRLEALMGFVDVMLSDYANYMLQIAAPKLIESATPYEAKMFAQSMAGQELGPVAATTAWRAARQRLYEEASRRDPEGINHVRSTPTAQRIYAEMLVDVFLRLAPPGAHLMPEMLLLDHNRAVWASNMTRNMIVTGAILLQCKNLLKRDVRDLWKNEAQRVLFIMEKIEPADPSRPQMPDTVAPHAPQESIVDGVMVALETGRSMPAATSTHLRALVAKFIAAGAEAAVADDQQDQPREPVLRLLLHRLKSHVLGRLTAVSAREKAKTASMAGERLAGAGLAEFVDKVREMVDMLSRVALVDKDAHGNWWDKVAAKVEAQAGPQAQTSTPRT